MIFIEPYMTKPVLMIVGGGHIGRPLSEIARVTGYEVKIVDVQQERGNEPMLDPSEITLNTHIVLITENHVTDEQTLSDILPTPASYIGMIGSQRKIRTVLEHLREDGFSQEQLNRLYGPIGFDPGDREPAQIVLAILAEIEMARHKGSGRPKSEAVKKHGN